MITRPTHRRSNGIIHAVLVAALVVAVVPALAARRDQPPETEPRIVLKLDNGRLAIGRVLRAAYAAMELKPPARLAALTWSIDVHTLAGRAQLDAVSRLTKDAIQIAVDDDRCVVTYDRDKAEQAVVGARRSVETWMDDVTDRLATPPPVPPQRRPGITFVTDADEHTTPAAFLETNEHPARVVVLIHGLDDPGWMWRDMIPHLREHGFVVARMEYPNDGPIADSADLFALALADLRTRGVDRVDVVAHSMGGLVTRDVLTRRAYYAGDARGSGRFPAIERFIMCGTPNHGSSMARLRAVSEIKEHISRAYSGNGGWYGGLADGGGEAAVDLLPDSEFLRRLNARAAPTGVRPTIIAGRMSPVRREDIKALGGKLRAVASSVNAPRWLQDALARGDAEATSLLDEAVRGLGDGCVTIDSARLDGVDDIVIVEANHVSMIVRIAPTVSGDLPPALPIVVNRLGRGDVNPDSAQGSKHGQ
ncbi:MAG: alpha/beta fold hydrolase [Planctomycetes bacterium]|nr:alpha/beta fold hydrolase [Planctomycetota bacterium]